MLVLFAFDSIFFVETIQKKVLIFNTELNELSYIDDSGSGYTLQRKNYVSYFF
jgi:hypothetical protein